MLTKILSAARMTLRHGSPSAKGFSALGSAEQTRRSWALAIESFAAVPDIFKEHFQTLLGERPAFPYTVFTPDFQGFLHRSNEKLICDLGEEVCVLERRGHSSTGGHYPLDAISYVEFTSALLDSRITISGITREGVPEVSTLRFNSVTDYLIQPIVERIRVVAAQARARPPVSEPEGFEQWKDLNYKFMNYARRSLLEDEIVSRAILQPEIRSHEVTVLGRKFYKLISPTHASILTDRELILIAEGTRKWAREERYGGSWLYLPLEKLSRLSTIVLDDRLIALRVEPIYASPIERIFGSTAELELTQLVDLFHEWVAA